MVTIREVKTKKDIKQFIRLPWKVYKDYPAWVPPLITEMKHALDPNKHPFFEFGESTALLAEKDGEVVGRVTAHVNHKHNDYHKTKDGFFGFYEAIDDEEVATALMDAVEKILKEKGMNKVIGPENYTIYDEVGFLQDGWENEPKTPVLLEVYTPKYYLDHMAATGFEKEIDWLALMVGEDAKVKDIYRRIKQKLLAKGFVFRPLNMKKIDEELVHIKKIVNNSWDENWGHVPYTDKQFEEIAKALKAIVDPRIVYMVEKDGEAVGCGISLPDINEGVKKMNGRLFPFGWWHFLRAKKKAVGIRSFLYGVLPKYRNLGIDMTLVLDTIDDARAAGYRWSDCSLIVETNKNMLRPVRKWGGKDYRTYRIFSKQI